MHSYRNIDTFEGPRQRDSSKIHLEHKLKAEMVTLQQDSGAHEESNVNMIAFETATSTQIPSFRERTQKHNVGMDPFETTISTQFPSFREGDIRVSAHCIWDSYSHFHSQGPGRSILAAAVQEGSYPRRRALHLGQLFPCHLQGFGSVHESTPWKRLHLRQLSPLHFKASGGRYLGRRRLHFAQQFPFHLHRNP